MKILLCICSMLTYDCLFGQDREERLREVMDRILVAEHDDSYQTEQMDQLAYYLDHPLDLNTGQTEDFAVFFFIAPVLFNNLQAHKIQFGDLQDLLELQIIPGWDLNHIRMISPFVTIRKGRDQKLSDIVLNSRHDAFLMVHQALQKRRGISEGDYLGNGLKSTMRYRITNGNRFSAGFTAEKDPGEPFGSFNYGFDFYSGHIFYRPNKLLRSMVIGDYLLMFGQGVTIGSGMMINKSGFLAAMKRNMNGFRPYRSSNEMGFNRGFAADLAFEEFKSTLWISSRKIDADRKDDGSYSAVEGAFHRTHAEIASKGKGRKKGAGLNVTWNRNKLQLGYSVSIDRTTAFEEEITQTFVQGINYSYLISNINFYGEVARSDPSGTAILSAMLVSLSKNLDLSLIYRTYSKTFNGASNSFGESGTNSNETGLFLGISWTVSRRTAISGYYDIFHSSWLKYLTDAPSNGNDHQVEVIHKPDKKGTFTFRIRNSYREKNIPDNLHFSDQLESTNKTDVRLHYKQSISESINLQWRVERTNVQPDISKSEVGYLVYQDIGYKKPMGKISFHGRICFFSTDGYNSRMYAYENDILYAYSVPALNGRGVRSYLLVNADLGRNVEIWIRYGRTLYDNLKVVGTGNEETQGPLRSDLKIQLRIHQ